MLKLPRKRLIKDMQELRQDPISEITFICLDETDTYRDKELVKMCGECIWTVYVFNPWERVFVAEEPYYTLFPLSLQPAYLSPAVKKAEESLEKIERRLTSYLRARSVQTVLCAVVDEIIEKAEGQVSVCPVGEEIYKWSDALKYCQNRFEPPAVLSWACNDPYAPTAC